MDETQEDRVRFIRTAFKFRVELHAHEERMPRDLDRFHQKIIR